MNWSVIGVLDLREKSTWKKKKERKKRKAHENLGITLLSSGYHSPPANSFSQTLLFAHKHPNPSSQPFWEGDLRPVFPSLHLTALNKPFLCCQPQCLSIWLAVCQAKQTWLSGFPGGSTAKNLPANAGDVGDVGLIPGLERSPARGNSNPFQSSCLGKSHGQGSLAGYSS